MTMDELMNAIAGTRNIPDTAIPGNIYGFGGMGGGAQSRSPTYWKFDRDFGRWLPYAQPAGSRAFNSAPAFYSPPEIPGPQFNPGPMPIFQWEGNYPTRQRYWNPAQTYRDMHLMAALAP